MALGGLPGDIQLATLLALIALTSANKPITCLADMSMLALSAAYVAAADDQLGDRGMHFFGDGIDTSIEIFQKQQWQRLAYL